MIAVTDEERSLVDKYVERNKPLYPVVIESVDSGSTFGIVQGYPTQYVIDASGKIAWAGNFFDQEKNADAILEKLLEDAKVPPDLPERFSAVRKMFQDDKLGAAVVALRKASADPSVPDDDRKGADAVVKWVEEQAAAEIEAAKKLADGDDVVGAGRAYDRIQARYAGIEAADQAKASLKELASDPKRKRELEADKALTKAKEKTAGMDPKKALPQFKLLVVNWKGTKASEEAARIVKELEAKAGK